MLSAEVLKKHYGWDKNTLDEFYKCQLEPMEFPWLSDVKSWIEDTYDVTVMTISYELRYGNIDVFTIYLKKQSELNSLPLVGESIWDFHCEEIENRIKMYYSPATNNSLKCELGFYTFEMRAKNYILIDKCIELQEEINSLFKPYNPTYISPERPKICVFNTKKEARDFLLSDDIIRIKKQIYDLLKPYDEYDVLRKEDISIVVDYEERKKRIPMYSRCISDMSKEEFEDYENQIING